MLARAGALPPVEDDAAWAYEMKWDGMRALGEITAGALTVRTRNGRDSTVSFPEIAPLAAQLGSLPAVLDGEIVAFDGVQPSFGRLQTRMHITGADRARRAATQVPVVYLVFDLLYLDGRSLLDLRYDTRRDLLQRLELDGPAWRTPSAFAGSGAEAVRASRRRKLEGVIAKRRDSPYRPGHRSAHWVKIKHVRTQEVVIGGWKEGLGERYGGLGSLLLGLPAPGGLVYVGRVGTGFSEHALVALQDQLDTLASPTSPFAQRLAAGEARGAHWVRPSLVGEVAFGEWTQDGRLRHPTWRGLRPDKDTDDVVRES